MKIIVDSQLVFIIQCSITLELLLLGSNTHLIIDITKQIIILEETTKIRSESVFRVTVYVFRYRVLFDSL